MEKKELTPEQKRVMWEKGTEAPFSGEYLDNKKEGGYHCAACGAMLFSSSAKFDSGTGWPSFTEPANLANVELRTDSTYGMERTEVTCKNCGAHLGHVFNDPPRDPRDRASGPTTRYCINSVCLDFKEKND